MPDISSWLRAVRSSHDRLSGLLGQLSAEQIAGPSYDTEWSVAQVASHLGSQAEIFELFLDAGLAGEDAPGSERFPLIWDRWNALEPSAQVAESISANERFVARLEALTAEQQQEFRIALFGRDVDLAGLAAMRLGEHAVHAWDVAVVVDPAAEIAPDAVDLLVDTLAQTAARAGRPLDNGPTLSIDTVDPSRHARLRTSPDVSITLIEPSPGVAGTAEARLSMPAAALIRLVYGRLDPDHTPAELAGEERITLLRQAFPGF
jgi:uncharacterized protein (TIGR03083 family)